MMKLDRTHAHQFAVSLLIGFGVVIIVYASINLYSSLTRYQLETMVIRAQEAQNAGNLEEAIRIRTTIYQTDPENTENTYELAVLYDEFGDPAKAKEYASEYVNKTTENTKGNVLLGKIALRDGDIETATTRLKSAYDETQHPEASYYLGLISMSNNEDPTNFLQPLENGEGSIPQAQSALAGWQKAQDEQNPIFKDALIAFHLLDVEQPYLAITLLEQVVLEEPAYRDGHYLLGVSYAETGNFAKAREELNKALEIDPEHEASKNALTVIADKVGEQD